MEQRGALFFIFLQKERKKTKNKTKRPKKWTHTRSDDLFLHTHIRTLTRNTKQRRKTKKKKKNKTKRNNSALYSYIVLSHLLKQISSSLEVVVFYDSVKARTFFSSVAPKVTYRFGAFFDTKFNDNKNNNHYNHKR